MLGHVAVGTWSGGRFMHFGEPISDDRLESLLRPGEGIRSVMTADAYGAGAADSLLGRTLRGVPRSSFALAERWAMTSTRGEREGAKGYPRFTDPRLRGPDGYAAYLRMAVERASSAAGWARSTSSCSTTPTGAASSREVWEALRAIRDEGLTRMLGLAPGPANGFTLDVIACFERYGELIDWAMLILNPFEPWPGELALEAATRNHVKVVTRVVDYGGLFHDDVLPGHGFLRTDHRGFRPEGWVEAGRAKLDGVRPIAERHALAASARLCLEPRARGRGVRGPHPDPGARRARQADRAKARGARGGAELPGADRGRGRRDPARWRQPRFDAPEGRDAGPRGRATRPDRWGLDEELEQVARRWAIDPARDLRAASAVVARAR